VVFKAVSDPLLGLSSTYFASEPNAASPFHPNVVLKYDGIPSFCATVGSRSGVGTNDPLTAVINVDQLAAVGNTGKSEPSVMVMMSAPLALDAVTVEVMLPGATPNTLCQIFAGVVVSVCHEGAAYPP
jgi:hypothetical protein